MTAAYPALAIDIGGTKFAAGLVEPGGRVISWSQTATPRELDAEQLWRTLDALVTRVLTDAEVNPASELAGVGCGCGGPMEWPAGKVSPLNIPAWQAFPLRDRLRERFGGLPVRLHNDAICFAVGEHWRGAGRGRTTMLGIVVSTGVGGGLVLDGKLIDGATGNAGHIGHVVVDPDGPPCVCGGRGCVEAIARGPALASWPRCAGRAGRSASPSPRRHTCATWRWSPSAAASPRPGHCCSSRWKRRCGPMSGSPSHGTWRWCRPRSARARDWSGRPRCCSRPTGTGGPIRPPRGARLLA
jgi:predicted NBD/HSP70 family sugar kinase